MENISVSPELNPKVNGNYKLEHDCADVPLIASSVSESKIISYNNKVGRLFRIFNIMRTSYNICNF